VATGAAVPTVRVNWGDGQCEYLGPVSGNHPASHTYASGGGYTVSATATMTDGSTEPSTSTPISVGEFSVGLSCTGTTTATCTATVTPNTTNVSRYEWVVTASDGTHTITRSTDGPSTSFSLQSNKTYTVQVTVVPVVGRTRSNSTTVTT
jgi:hypothetical protein